jgi:hypothetical protein
MEGLRRKLIPRELFSGLMLPNVGAARNAVHFAAGGMVSTSTQQTTAATKGSDKQPIKLTNINVVDPAMMASYLASNPGEKQILNIISNNKFAVSYILSNR